MSRRPPPPFFTTDINNEFLSRFKNPQVRAQVQIPAIENYQVLTLFEFLEKLEKRTTSLTRGVSKDQHYQNVKVNNRNKMKDFLATYLCRGKIGRVYGVRAVERALYSNDYDVLIIANNDIDENVVALEEDDSDDDDLEPIDSQEVDDLHAEAALPPVASPLLFKTDSEALGDLVDGSTSQPVQEMTPPPDVPEEKGDWKPHIPSEIVIGEDGDSRFVHEHGSEVIDFSVEGESEDLEEESEEEESEEEESQGRPGPAWREDPKNAKKQTNDSLKIRDKKLRSVVGFLIVQKGECRAFPEDYAVNLICVKDDDDDKPGTGALPGTGPLLIGLYLYTIIERRRTMGHLQLGLLELAGGYYNIAGLCLYSKFGFEPTINLAIPGCFSSPGNMPMELHIPSKYGVGQIDTIKQLEDAKQIICSIIAGERFHKGFKLPVCKVRTNQSALIALREYHRLLEYRRYKMINRSSFNNLCSYKPDLDLINSQSGTAFERRVYGTLVPELIDDMESFDPITLMPNVSLDDNDKEFIRIISSVGPNTLINTPMRIIQSRYRQALVDYRTLCEKKFPAEATQRPGGGRTKKTKKRNNKTIKRNKNTIKRNNKATKRSK